MHLGNTYQHAEGQLATMQCRCDVTETLCIALLCLASEAPPYHTAKLVVMTIPAAGGRHLWAAQ